MFNKKIYNFNDSELTELKKLTEENKVDNISDVFIENEFLFVKDDEIIFPKEIKEIVDEADIEDISNKNKFKAIEFYLSINGALSIDKLKELLEITGLFLTKKDLKDYLKELNIRVSNNYAYLNEFAFNMDKEYGFSKVKESWEYATYDLEDIDRIMEQQDMNDYIIRIYKNLRNSIRDPKDCFNTANKIYNLILFDEDFDNKIQDILNSKNIKGTEEDIDEFNNLMQDIYDNTPAWYLNGYYPKDKETNLSDEEINSILSHINMYLIMNGVIEIDKLLDILVNNHGFEVTRDELIAISKIYKDNCIINNYFCVLGIDERTLKELVKGKKIVFKYKIIDNIDKFFLEHDIVEEKIKKLINKYTNNKEVIDQIISILLISKLDMLTLNMILKTNKIDLPENKQNRMLKDLENCQKNIRMWTFNGYTMNELKRLC